MEDKKEMLELGEKMVSSKEVYDGKLLHVYKDMVVLPNGRETARELIRHNGACAVVPLLDNGNVIAERQFRYPFGEVVTEIPAGKLDSPDEDHLEAVQETACVRQRRFRHC